MARKHDIGFPGNDHGIPIESCAHYDTSQELEGGRKLCVLRYWQKYKPAPIYGFAIIDGRTDETAAKGWALMRATEQISLHNARLLAATTH